MLTDDGETVGTLQIVPNKPKTPHRTVRVPDEEWDAAKVEAARRGETLTDAIRRFLREYGKSGR